MKLANLEPLTERFVGDIYEAEEDAPIEEPLPGDEFGGGEITDVGGEELPPEGEEGPLPGEEGGVDDIPLEAREELMMNIASAIGEVLNVETDVSKEGGEEEELPPEEGEEEFPPEEGEEEFPPEEEEIEEGWDIFEQDDDTGDMAMPDMDMGDMDMGDMEEDIYYEQIESMLQESKRKTKQLRKAMRDPRVLQKVKAKIKRNVRKSKKGSLASLRNNPKAVDRLTEAVIRRLKKVAR